jgi:hypothetical protein
MAQHLELRKGRHFHPRLPKAELNHRATDRMTECGAQNNLQAKFQLQAATLAQEVNEPQFLSLQSKPKLSPQNKAWCGAFTVVLAYLNDFEMRYTRATLDVESHGVPFPEDQSILKGRDAADFVADLIRLSNSLKNIEVRFRESVRDFVDAGPSAVIHPTSQPLPSKPVATAPQMRSTPAQIPP